MSIHIGAEQGEIAPTVLLPGESATAEQRERHFPQMAQIALAMAP